MSEEEKLRQRIQWLTDTLSVCRDHAQREALIQRLLDTPDRLMFLKLRLPQTAPGARNLFRHRSWPLAPVGLCLCAGLCL